MSKKLMPSDEFSPIFNRILLLCEAQNTSVSTLLDMYATSRSSINTWKKGNISATTIAKIAEHLNVTLDYLITGKEKSASNSSINTYSLSDDEQELLDAFKLLSEKSKGKLLERAASLAEFEATVDQERPGIIASTSPKSCTG